MAQLWMDGFDHYGGDIGKILEGPWASITEDFGGDVSLGAPAGDDARTGPFALKITQPLTGLAGQFAKARRVLGGDFGEIFIGSGMYLEEIPETSGTHFPIQIKDSGNAAIGTLTVRADGGAQFRSGGNTGSILGQTTGPVFQANTWHHIELRFVRDAAAGIFELRVDEVEVLNLTGLAMGANDSAQIETGIASPITGVTQDIMLMDDMVTRNNSGTVNNGFEGDLKVATLQTISNGVNQGWIPRSIQKLGPGVMEFLDTDNDEAIAYADNAVFEIGSGDFAIETFVRFTDVVGDDTFATILSKWRETTDERSWRLIVEGANLSGNLIFSTSSDGTSGDVVDVHTFPFVPDVDRWVHIAVTRDGTISRLFIDGVQAGTNQTDSRTYDDNASSLFVNGSQLTTTTTNNDESVDGWMDGVRVTVGAARYTANFVPPSAALPDTVGGDPLFNSVELLLNFDDLSNLDQSSNAFVGTLINSPSILFPDDDEAFQTIASLAPDDNNFVEAELVAAEGTLTFTGQPLDTETVTLGATTYTFQTVLVDAADNVLIGVDLDTSLDNLKAAVGLEAGVGTLFGTGTVINPDALLFDLVPGQKLARARTAGAAGNAIVSTETLTNGSWGGATLSGGLDIPTNSEFNLGALPADVTGVRAVALISRSFKTDAGSSGLTMSFVTSDGSSGAGAEHALTVNPTYIEDTIEVDPSTAGNLTPSSLNASRIRLNRTL